jgi:hypothetical protein
MHSLQRLSPSRSSQRRHPVLGASRRAALGWALALPLFAAGCTTASTDNASLTTNRAFPANAWRGQLEVQSLQEGRINGQPVRFAPGVVMRGEDNTVRPTTYFAGQRLMVHYTVDTLGNVDKAWVLTTTELGKSPWPRNAAEAAGWAFDPLKQAWTR